jgi:hypothetical protein
LPWLDRLVTEQQHKLRGVLPTQSSIDTVAMKGSNPGADFGRKVAIGLKERNIETKVSSKRYLPQFYNT